MLSALDKAISAEFLVLASAPILISSAVSAYVLLVVSAFINSSVISLEIHFHSPLS